MYLVVKQTWVNQAPPTVGCLILNKTWGKYRNTSSNLEWLCVKLEFSPLLLQSSGARARLVKAKNLGLRICLQIVMLTCENMKNNVRDVYGISLSSVNILRKFTEWKLQRVVPSTWHATSAFARKSLITHHWKRKEGFSGEKMCRRNTYLTSVACVLQPQGVLEMSGDLLFLEGDSLVIWIWALGAPEF